MPFKIVLHYLDGESEEQEEVFDTEEDAWDYAGYLVGCSELGNEILHLSNPGDNPLSDDEIEPEVIEI